MIKTFPAVEADPGVTRQVLSETPALMVVSFRFAAGARGQAACHPHVQSTYCRSGRFRFSLSGESFEVGPGDSFVIPSNARMDASASNPATLIDTFTPRRDDFL
jgi:quercetin dioxygenase-like cupin family protein